MSPDRHGAAGGPRPVPHVVEVFHQVASTYPWYRTLLDERGVSPDAVRSVDDFVRLCPPLGKHNTFARFPIHELAAATPLTGLAGVLTSSGHGGQFSFGLISRAEQASGGAAIDAALDAAFEVCSRPTLAVNCLPMGVTFASERMTVATTSVREDMALALVETFGPAFAQVLLVADPLFLKRLVDYAAGRLFDWRRYRVQVVVGEEVFGEHFRRYMSSRLGLGSAEHPDTYLMSSFGVGELGLHLLFETRATAALRRLASADVQLARDLLGEGTETQAPPMFFTYSPSRLFVEADAPAADGFGLATLSLLDPSLPIPLLRYQTGDVLKVLDARQAAAAVAGRGLELPGDLPPQLVAVRGRVREALPNGTTVLLYKDVIYADEAIADRLTGAVRLTFDGARPVMHVQLVRECHDGGGIASAIMDLLPEAARPSEVVVWPYEAFPFGMTLDYERKFTSYAAP